MSRSVLREHPKGPPGLATNHDVGGLRVLIRNVGVLFSGNSVATALGLVSWTLTARALGVDRFGVLVLIQTYVLTIDAVVNFQSWQSTILYGAKAIERHRDDELSDVLKFGLAVDVGSAVVGTGLALGGAYLFCQWQGWGNAELIMIALYSLTITLHISGTPTAVLRLFGQFDRLAWQQTLTAVLRLLFVSVTFFIFPTVWGFLIAWLLSELGGSALLLALSWRELNRRGLRPWKEGRIRHASERHEGIWRFVWTTNVNSSVTFGGRQLDVLLLGTLVAPSAAGILKIIKLFVKVLGALSVPFDQAVYPDLARLWSSNRLKAFRLQITRVGLVGGTIGLIVWSGVFLIGPWILDTMFGEGYQSAYVPLLVYLAPSALSLFAIANRSALLSMEKVKAVFAINLASWVAYFIALPLLAVQLDVLGAAIAQSVHNVIWVVGTTYLIVRTISGRPATLSSDGSPTSRLA